MDNKVVSLYLSRILSGQYIFIYNDVTYKLVYPDTTIKYNAELYTEQVYDNSKSFYYQKEDGGDYVGLNEVDCDDMIIYMENQEVVKIVFKSKPVGILHPLQDINPTDFRLEGFTWQQERRPKKWSDIFTWY